MRLYEIASAEEQMALLKLIMDNTWQALVTQARQQAQQTAKKRAVKPATIATRKAIPVKAYRASLPKIHCQSLQHSHQQAFQKRLMTQNLRLIRRN